MTELAESYLERFRGLSTAYGLFQFQGSTSKSGKVAGRGQTHRGEVDASLWELHLKGDVQLGVVPIRLDGNCIWGAIDIDVYDLDLQALERTIQNRVLPLSIVRSKSGGAHLYLFLSEPVDAATVRAALGDWAVALGYPGVEIFPKQDELAGEEDVGNWLNMPYQGALHPEGTQRYALYQGEPVGVEEFLELAAARAVDRDTLETVKPAGGPVSDGPPCLQTMALHGVPEGGRNEALWNFGVYAKLKQPDTWEQELNELNQQYMDPPLPFQEVADIAKSLRRKEYVYGCKKQPLAGYCNKEICRGRTYGIATAAGDQDPGIMLDGLTQLTSDPPVWFVTVNGVRMQVTTDELVSPRLFAKRCVQELRFLPPNIKENKWREIINPLLQSAEIVEAPSDAGPRGQFRVLVEQFVTGQQLGRDWEDILKGMPYPHDDGFVYFQSADLLRFLQNRQFREMKQHEIWAELRDMGAGHGQKSIKGKCRQLWHLPQYPAQTEGFSVPQVDQPEF